MQGICGQVHWLRKPMLAYGKNMPRNNQFSVFWPELIKNYPENKFCPKLRNFYPEKKVTQPIKSSQRQVLGVCISMVDLCRKKRVLLCKSKFFKFRRLLGKLLANYWVRLENAESFPDAAWGGLSCSGGSRSSQTGERALTPEFGQKPFIWQDSCKRLH